MQLLKISITPTESNGNSEGGIKGGNFQGGWGWLIESFFFFFFSGAPSKIEEQAISYFTVNRCFKEKITIIFTDDLCIEIRKPNSKAFLIAAWYRPPCSSLDLFLYYKSFLTKVDSLGLEYYILGDLNCNLDTFQYDSNTRRLCEISDLFGLQQLITEPTCITETS